MSALIEFVSKRPEYTRTVVTMRVTGEAPIDEIVQAAKEAAHDSMPFGYRVERRADLYLIHIYTD